MVFGAIIGAVSAVASAVSNAVSSIGPALSSFAQSVGPVIANAVNIIGPVAESLGKFANVFLQAFGILQSDDNVEETGERALQAAGKGLTIDRFDDFESYIAALKNFELDSDKTHSKPERLTAGIGVGTVGVEDKLGMERGSLNGMWLLPMANPDYFTPERMEKWVLAGRLGGSVMDYLDKKLGMTDDKNFEESLKVDENAKPLSGDSEEKFYDAMDTARENWKAMGEEIDRKNNGGQG